MKYCPQCGQPAGDTDNFCPKCGAGIRTAPAIATPASQPAVSYPQTPVRKTNKALIAVIVAAVILFFGIPVILILAAIAIPNLLRARVAANEQSAIIALQTLNTALQRYQSQYHTYPQHMEQLGPPAAAGAKVDRDHAGLIDYELANRIRQGYVFTYEVPEVSADATIDSYQVHADPEREGASGIRHFFTDQTGAIRADRRPADADSSPI